MSTSPNTAKPVTVALLTIHEEAAEWLLRQEDARWSHSDQQDFDAWQALSPAHQQVWQRMQRTNALLPQIPQTTDSAWRAATNTSANLAPQRKALVGQAPAQAAATAWRWGWASSLSLASLAIVVLGGGGFYWWDNTPSYSLQAQTRLGETRSIALPDGSQIELNVDSSLVVTYYPRRRETALHRGEAFFQVTADRQRPFTVDSNGSQVKVVGTVFNVKAAPPKLLVQVSEGIVEVYPDRDNASHTVVRLQAGTGIALDPLTRAYESVATPVGRVAEWRSGQLSFRRTPLRDVAADLSRYLGQPVRLAQAELGEQPISAVVSTQQPQAFLQALPDLLPMRAQQQADGSWLILRK